MVRRKAALLKVVGVSMLIVASALLISQSKVYGQGTGGQVGKFTADLQPRAGSNGTGKAILQADPDLKTIWYNINASGIKDIKSVAISMATGTGRAPDVVTLRLASAVGVMQVPANGTTLKGNFTKSDLIGPLDGKGLSDFVKAITDGKIGIRVESYSDPLAELAGKVNAG